MNASGVLSQSAKLRASLKQNSRVVYLTFDRRSGAAVIGHLPKRLRKRVELRVVVW